MSASIIIIETAAKNQEAKIHVFIKAQRGGESEQKKL